MEVWNREEGRNSMKEMKKSQIDIGDVRRGKFNTRHKLKANSNNHPSTTPQHMSAAVNTFYLFALSLDSRVELREKFAEFEDSAKITRNLAIFVESCRGSFEIF